MTPEARLRADFSFGAGQATAAVRSRDFECQVEEAKETVVASIDLGPAEEGSENSAVVDGQRY